MVLKPETRKQVYKQPAPQSPTASINGYAAPPVRAVRRSRENSLSQQSPINSNGARVSIRATANSFDTSRRNRRQSTDFSNSSVEFLKGDTESQFVNSGGGGGDGGWANTKTSRDTVHGGMWRSVPSGDGTTGTLNAIPDISVTMTPCPATPGDSVSNLYPVSEDDRQSSGVPDMQSTAGPAPPSTPPAAPPKMPNAVVAEDRAATEAATELPGMRVYARVKPAKSQQDTVLNGGFTAPSEESDKSKVTVQISKQTNDTKTFHLDGIFGGAATQKEVYDSTAAPLIQAVMCGFNATILAYGQTSSGKTHTMEGPPIMRSSNAKAGEGGLSAEEAEHLMGIVPRAVRDIFREIDRRKQRLGGNVEEISLTLSVMEIYMENVHDLLSPARSRKKENLKIREDPSRGVFVEGITELTVITQDEILDALAIGQSNRAVGDTHMNQFSSRSHLVCTVSVRHKNHISLAQRVGKLHLVDLAGSEKANKSMVEGLSLDEAKTINKSLSCLGNVIHALTDSKGAEKGGRNHIPYRDSKLTRILQESLGGNSKTTLICTVSAADTEKGETLSTLRFGQRAKRVTNTAVVNQERSVQFLEMLLKRSEKKIKQLKTRVARLERSLKDAHVEVPVEVAAGTVGAPDVYEPEQSPRQPLVPTLSMLRSFSMGSAPMMADVNGQEARPLRSDFEDAEPITPSGESIARTTHRSFRPSRTRSGPLLTIPTSDDESDVEMDEASGNSNDVRPAFTTSKSDASLMQGISSSEISKGIPLLKLEKRKEATCNSLQQHPLSSSTLTAGSSTGTLQSQERPIAPLFTFGNIRVAPCDLLSSEETDRTYCSFSPTAPEVTPKAIWLRPRGREMFSARRKSAEQRLELLKQQTNESVMTEADNGSLPAVLEAEAQYGRKSAAPTPPSPPSSCDDSTSTLEQSASEDDDADLCDDSEFPPSPPSPPLIALDSASNSSYDLVEYCSASHSTAACHNSVHAVDSSQMRRKQTEVVIPPHSVSVPEKSATFVTKHLLLDLIEANKTVDDLCDSGISLFSNFLLLLLDNHGLKAELLALRSRLAVDAVRLLRRRRRAATRSGCISGRLRFMSNCRAEEDEQADNESSSDDEHVVRAVSRNLGRRCGPAGGWSDFMGKHSSVSTYHGVLSEQHVPFWGSERLTGGNFEDQGLKSLFSPGLWEVFDRSLKTADTNNNADAVTSRQVTIGLQTTDSLAWHDRDSTVDGESDRMHDHADENQLDGMTCFAPSRLVTLAESLQKAFFSGTGNDSDGAKVPFESLSAYVKCYTGAETSTKRHGDVSTLLLPPIMELQRRQRCRVRRFSDELSQRRIHHVRSLTSVGSTYPNAGVLFGVGRVARRWSLPSPAHTNEQEEYPLIPDKIPQLFASVAAQQVKNKRSGLRPRNKVRPRNRVKSQVPARPATAQPYRTSTPHTSCSPKFMPVSQEREVYFPTKATHQPSTQSVESRKPPVAWLDISGNGAAGTGESSSSVVCVERYEDSRITSHCPSIGHETGADPDCATSPVNQLFGGFLAGAFRFLDGRAS